MVVGQADDVLVCATDMDMLGWCGGNKYFPLENVGIEVEELVCQACGAIEVHSPWRPVSLAMP